MAMPYLARRPVLSLIVLSFILVCLVAAQPTGAGARLADFERPPGSFTLFESGQVRPLALSPTGKFLFAANTPDNRLEVFRIVAHGLEHRASIPVGLEPVAVAARSDTQVWVVNHLSDSVSVVELGQGGHSGRRAPLPLRHVALLELRGFILRQLPCLRRLRQPGLGSRQSGRLDVDVNFAVNTRAYVLMMSEHTRRLLERNAHGGRIINVSTDAAHAHAANVSYAASKHAIESYSRSAAVELGKYGITVKIVAPGPIQTGYLTPDEETSIAAGIPLGRIGRPDDVADVIVFLASEQARWVTGQLV